MASRILIVGGGSIGERHLRCFQQIGAQVALCETLESRRKDVAGRYLCESFSTVEDAARHAWDAAVICTPAHLHVPHAVTLAPQTQAMLIEKPLATQDTDIPRLIAATRGKPVMIAYVFRSHPAVHELRRQLRDETLGPLHQITVLGGQHFPTFRPAYREIYYAKHETGGGCIQDAATHMIDLVSYLAGRFDWVFCDAAHQELAGVEVEDTVNALGRLNGNRVLFSLAENQFMAGNELQIHAHCARGSLQLKLPDHTWGILRHGDSQWQMHGPMIHERDDLFRRQARLFLDVCAGRVENPSPLEDARHTLQVNLALLRSWREQRIVRLT
ncbi:MAG: Gfo/Idh/MocA family oxidoreductase [Planctomycetaceae bacterium]|nr:Gfo/Idh/MocA family oxidoreductase [Planctomycetaceae bacterium]